MENEGGKERRKGKKTRNEGGRGGKGGGGAGNGTGSCSNETENMHKGERKARWTEKEGQKGRQRGRSTGRKYARKYRACVRSRTLKDKKGRAKAVKARRHGGGRKVDTTTEDAIHRRKHGRRTEQRNELNGKWLGGKDCKGEESNTIMVK